MSDILTSTYAGVMTITLNRAEKKNAITSTMYTTMADALNQAANDGAVRIVLIQGHETIFCAGNDIGDFLNHPPTAEESPVYRFLQTISVFPKPLIAAVCGAAVGVGTTLLLHCDLVYAGDNASFSLPFVNLGLCPEAGSSLLFPQMLGYHRAAEVMLLGDALKVDAALATGLVNRVMPPVEVNAFALAQARKLTTKPMSSLLEIKRLMKRGQTSLVKAQMTEEGMSFARMLKEPAAKEAFTAFLEKRKPDFSRV